MRTNLVALLLLSLLCLPLACIAPADDDDDDDATADDDDSGPADDDDATADDDDDATGDDDDDSAGDDDDAAGDDDDTDVLPSDAELALVAHLEAFVAYSFPGGELTFVVEELEEIGAGSNIGDWGDDLAGAWIVLGGSIAGDEEVPPAGFAALAGAGASDFRTDVVMPRLVAGATVFAVDWTLGAQDASVLAVVAEGAVTADAGDHEVFLEPVSATHRTLASADVTEETVSLVLADGFGATVGGVQAEVACVSSGCSGSAGGADAGAFCTVEHDWTSECDDAGAGCLTTATFAAWCGDAAYDQAPSSFGRVYLTGSWALATECDCIEGADADGDTFTPADGDCDDEDPSVYPGAPELCDETDSDCDGSVVDEDTDTDNDLVPDCTDEDDDDDGFPDAVDCGPEDPAVYPNAPELCDDLDSDCDTSLVDGFDDFDGDGTPDCTDDDDDDDGDPDATDCADLDPLAYTGATEICDGIDNDCDAAIDDGFDVDGDGVTTCAGDCDDGDADNFPGNAEVCDDADNDCDGALSSDEIDDDGDGVDECDADPDCDDADPDNFPGNVEVCDGADNDCDGVFGADELDGDGDGATLCDLIPDCDDADPDNFPGNVEQCDDADNDCDGAVGPDEIDDDGDGVDECDVDPDCDDADPDNFPGNAEACDGLDNDCDGLVPADETDDDGDTFDECADGDCDDTDPTIYDGAPEVCEDGIDQDCDGGDDSCCQMAVFSNSGSAPNCWCANTSSTTTVTVAGYAEAITENSQSTNTGCNSCPPYTTEVVWFEVGTHTLWSQATPCTCSPSSLVISGQYAVTPVCGP